jgi:replicative DNA helicase
MGECLTKLKGGSEVFYDLRNQAIFDEMAVMYDKREPIDLVTLRQRLKDKKLLEEGGGIAYINSFRELVPTPAHIQHYLNSY